MILVLMTVNKKDYLFTEFVEGVGAEGGGAVDSHFHISCRIKNEKKKKKNSIIKMCINNAEYNIILCRNGTSVSQNASISPNQDVEILIPFHLKNTSDCFGNWWICRH